MMHEEEDGRKFRDAWIAGVKAHFPSEPKHSYIAQWDETADWERESAAAVYRHVRALIESTDGRTLEFTRSQKGQFVALCWIGQIYKHFEDPKPGYVADWDKLPAWQQETDADIFEKIELELSRTVEAHRE